MTIAYDEPRNVPEFKTYMIALYWWVLLCGHIWMLATYFTGPLVLQPGQDDFAKCFPMDYCNDCRSYQPKWPELLQWWLVLLTQREWNSEKSCTMQYDQLHGLHGMVHDYCISNVCKGKRSAVRNCTLYLPKSHRLIVTRTVHLEYSPPRRKVAIGAPQTNDTSK
jgi:hypothetical protein